MAHSINRAKRKFMAVGCSHGHLINHTAEASVLRFIEHYNPKVRIHLGDYADQTAFRTQASEEDRGISIETDTSMACQFLLKMRATHVINGNHDDRIWQRCQARNEVVATAARAMVREVESTVKRLRAVHITTYNIREKCFVELGDTKFLHGFMYNENAMRDHAEHFGKCVIAHLHKVGMSPGRRHDTPIAYCVGTLADIPAMDYASRRRATSQWSAGIAYGEFDEEKCQVNLLQLNPDGSLPSLP